MASWSAENAIRAYLRAMKMKTTAKEPDVAEFISALAAGNNAQLMVVACASLIESGNHVLALEAAAQQTGGAVICILPNCVHDYELQYLSEKGLGDGPRHVKFVTGDAEILLMNEYKEADCILVDCNLENCQAILETVRRVSMNNSATVLAYNARRMGSWRCEGLKNAHFLPIGEGLLVTKMDENAKSSNGTFAVCGKKNRWLTKIDKYTGEEHVFRI